MDLNDQLPKMKHIAFPVPREEEILKTIERSKELYFQQERDRLMTYWEFLWTQLHHTRKRWWVLQAALLLSGCQFIQGMEDDYSRVRSIGVIGCLFVVFMIPELWRNRENDSIQVEAACLYSLRQIYAARITLFGMVDILLLTLFSFSLGYMGMTFTEVTAQFLLPATITACICFSLLCGRRNLSEAASLAACFLWCGVWWLLLVRESVYSKILPAAWLLLFALALTFLVFTVRRAVRTTNQYWEVNFA